MKTLLAIFTVLLLAWGSSALAQDKALDDSQLDLITAGSAGGAVAHTSGQSVSGTNVSPNLNHGVDALNVSNAASTKINTVDVDDSVNIVDMSGDVQEEAIAVTITNGIGNKVGNGVNANASMDHGLGSSLNSSMSGTGIPPTISSGPQPFISQTNSIIIQ